MDTGTISEKRGLNMEEACTYIGEISRPTLYKLMGEGAIGSYFIGVRRYVTRESLDNYINSRIGLYPEVDDIINAPVAPPVEKVVEEDRSPRPRKRRLGPFL